MKTTIELAREAGFETMLRKGKILGFDRDGDYTEELKAFEALVRADERNSWPAEMEAMERQVNILTDALAAEREACAKVCESLPMQQDVDVRDQAAAAIRARGEHMTCKHRWLPSLFGIAWRRPNHYLYQCTRCSKFIGTTLKEQS